MVNNKVLSRFGDFCPESGAPREIKGGPLYSTHEVIELLSPDTVIAWTRGCQKDIQKWAFEVEDLIRLIRLAVQSGRFLKSIWCQQKPGGPWAACDSYSVWSEEWSDEAYKYLSIEYYLKFAINKTGKLILTISCHPSGS